MSVDRRDVERIASLARLCFDDRELDQLTDELNQILVHFEVLQSLAVEGSEKAAVRGSGPTSGRPSEVGHPDRLEVGVQTIAPRWSEGFFVVPAPPGVHDDGEP